ncbi:tRNA threonylcarbamoyladenosine biosynthesis protein TsaE [Magnetospirillum moscoviense]|uniref:tRNA threonylcarbamoyladenosine biosynthesis protein TsaE n=2 Tax=Magnetospirillum moscoviense TaxID=1437059 RepID=A0A178MUY4_9PROT|nr:tRNA (adenosine(37)-N6)-threonylcarbamoyltransferase complex ATPase subunit type 1 TsaE [Magnetospirillum moscoviense]MBF0325287.1 tRNA (adenosine(37)-N6)-threonylcarbamoyltransferase complex ATPase subunit type 1 TsaE [Alphaproteobacteria bacterium]OAN54017.1 tRNA threonylcarbamoyladenosine biosynthesis protein TsaE [Magnetospirillum moscoviense]
MNRVFELACEADTVKLGAALARLARPGDVLLLAGTLGTGKSTLARAFIRALTDPFEEVPSPTFTLVQTYESDAGEIWHFDLYRLEKPDDSWELGIEDAFVDGICLIEWPDRLGPLVPRRRLEVTLESGEAEGSRRATLTPVHQWDDRLGDLDP